MPTPPFKRMRPGQPLSEAISASDENRLRAGVEQLERMGTAGEGPRIIRRGGAPLVLDDTPPWILIRITAGSNPYSFVEIRDDGAGGFYDLEEGASGDNAYEVSESTTVPVDTVCYARLSDDRLSWLFVAPPASVTVRKNSGTPDYGPRPRLNFIEGANVTLTVADDPTDNEVDVTIAASGGGAPGNDMHYYRHVGTGSLGEVWYGPTGGQLFSIGTTLTTGILYAYPFVVPRAITLDRMGSGVGVIGTAGMKARLGIYDAKSDIDLYPNALIVDAGEIDLHVSAFQTLTINTSLTPGLYFLAYTASANHATITYPAIGRGGSTFYGGLSMGTLMGVAVSGTVLGVPASAIKVGFTYAALPNPFPTASPLLSYNDNYYPIPFVRISSAP